MPEIFQLSWQGFVSLIYKQDNYYFFIHLIINRMRKFTFLLTLLMAFMTTAMAQLDTSKEYRVKHTETGNFMIAGDYEAHPTGPTGGVKFVAETESDDQVFTVEAEGTGYKLKTKSGKYIFCQQWNVDALDNATTLTFVENGNGTFKMKWSGGYFKVENVSGTYYPFCDAGLTASADFELVEVVATTPEVPATPLEVESVYPDFTVRELSEITVNFNAEIAGQFDPYSMTAMKFKKGNSVAAGVDSWTVEGNKLTVTLSQTVTEAGEYTLVIPEGLITRKSDGAAYSGELTFTLEEEPVAVPDAELAETYKGTLSIDFMGMMMLDIAISLDLDKDLDGNDKEGFASLKLLCQDANVDIQECVAYEVNGSTVVLKNVTVGDGDGGTKQADLTFAVQADGKLLSSDQVYGPTEYSSSFLFDFSQCPLAPEAGSEEPEQPEVPAVKLAETYKGTLSIDFMGMMMLDIAISLDLDKDLDGNDKEGFASLKLLCQDANVDIQECVAYEVNGSTVVLKNVTVGDGDGGTKQADLTFAVQADGKLLSSDQVYGPTEYSSSFLFDFSQCPLAPEAGSEEPEQPEVPAVKLASKYNGKFDIGGELVDGSLLIDQDVDGTAKAGYASLCFNLMGTPFNTSAPYELTETTLTMKGAVVGDGGMMGINKEEDIVFTINEDGSLTSTQNIYGNTQSTAFFAIQLSSDKFVPEATTPEVPETPETPEAQDTFTYTSASPATEEVQSYMSYITLNFGGEVAEVKTDAINVVDGKGNVVTTATLEADWFDAQVVGVTFADELSYTGTCSLTVPAQFITSTDSTYNPEFTLTYNLEAEAVEAYFYHPEYNAVMVMDSVANVATIKKNFTEEELAANAWELHPVGKDQYLISNKATGLYLGTCNTSVAVAGVDVANAKVYEMQKDGIYDVLKDVEGGSYTYLHAAASQNDKVVGWNASAAASHWFVLNSVEDYAYLAANLELTDSLTQMINKAEEVKDKTQPYYKHEALITDASQFNSNNKDPEEGSYAALLDGDNTTFFHSNWHGGGPEPHDLQVMLPNNDVTEFLVKYESRNSSGYRNDRPTKMSIYGGTRAEDGTVTFSTTPFANLTTANGIGEVAGEFKFTADTIYDAFKFEVHETVMTDGTKGKVFFTYGEFQLYSATLVPAEYTMPEMFAEVYDDILANAKNANPVEDSYSALIEELNRAINKVLYPAATVVAVDPACGHYAEMPGTIKLTFSEDVNTLEFGMVRTDFTGFRGYTLSEEDYTIEGKDLTITVPAEYVNGAADMMISLQVVDAKGQYVTYASDADYLSDEQVFLMYSADRKSNLFVMTATDPEAGVVEKLDVINMTFGEGNTYVGGFDTTKEVVVLNANDEVVTKATMEVVKESEVDPDTNESFSWPTSTVKFTLAAPVTEAGEYTLVVPEGTVYNEGFNPDAADFGVEWGAIYNPEVRVAYTVVPAEKEVDYTPRHTGTKERNDRNVTAVKLNGWLGEQVYNLTATEQSQDYTDATAVATFKVVAGEELTPVVDHAGEWVHHAVYVDFEGDGFTSGIEEGSEWKPAGNLVAYSFYNNGGSSDEYGYNSVGTSMSGMDRHMPVLPKFTAPTEPGLYRVRFVQTWCNIDPAGDADGKFGDFKGNGDQIVDVMIEVGEYTGINGVNVENANDVYTLDGRKVVVKAGQKLNKGLYIVGGKKVYVK